MLNMVEIRFTRMSLAGQSKVDETVLNQHLVHNKSVGAH